MDLGLKGKTALVTGASEGIGSAVARSLAEEGVRVAICARTEATLKKTAAEIARATGMEIVPIPADLRSLAGCQGVVAQAAERLGGIDILVNNAGASAFGAFVDLPDDAFVDAINGKLLGYIRCAKAVIPHMQRRGGGTIVNITGTTQQAVPLHTPGSACNAAIRMFSKELSMELGPLNIRVNSVAPGRIQTARADRLLEANAAAQGTSRDVVLGQLVKTIPSGRVGTIDDIADAVCFLVSKRATYVGMFAGVAANVFSGRLRWYDSILGLLVVVGAAWMIRGHEMHAAEQTLIAKGDVRLLGVVGAFSGLVVGLVGLVLAGVATRLALYARSRTVPPGEYYGLAAAPWLAVGGLVGFALGAAASRSFGVRLALP